LIKAAAAALIVTAATAAGAADRYWPPIVDPATGTHTPGRWVWADLVTADVATRIRERDPAAVITLPPEPARSGPAAVDDPYRDYVVPDDLTW
jgi:hypothetical protein